MASNAEEEQKKRDGAKALEVRELVKTYLNASKKGDVEELKRLVAEAGGQSGGEKALLATKEATGKTCLHFAAGMGRMEAVTYILEIAPGIVGIKDVGGNTALHMACRGGHLQVVEILVARGAKPGVTNNTGVTPLQHVDSPSIVQFLCKAGADPNALSESGGPLHFAASEGYADVVTELIGVGADPNLADQQGLAPIIVAAASGCGQSVAALVRGNADCGAVVSGGFTVLHICAEMEEADEALVAVTELLKTETGKKSALLKSDDGDLPIQLAANQGNEEVVRLLFSFSNLEKDTTIETVLEEGKVAKAKAIATEKEEANQRKSSKSESNSFYDLSGLENKEQFDEITKPAKSKEDEKHAMEHKAKGNEFLVKEKNYSRAIEEYSAGLKLQGNNEVLWSNRSAAFLSSGQYKHALRDALVCQKLKPDWLKGHYRVGQAYMAVENYIDAATAFWTALKVDPKNKEVDKIFHKAVKLGKEKHQREQSSAGGK